MHRCRCTRGKVQRLFTPPIFEPSKTLQANLNSTPNQEHRLLMSPAGSPQLVIHISYKYNYSLLTNTRHTHTHTTKNIGYELKSLYYTSVPACKVNIIPQVFNVAYSSRHRTVPIIHRARSYLIAIIFALISLPSPETPTNTNQENTQVAIKPSCPSVLSWAVTR